MNDALARALAAVLFFGILTCWSPEYWPVAALQTGAFLLAGIWLTHAAIRHRHLHVGIGLFHRRTRNRFAGGSCRYIETSQKVVRALSHQSASVSCKPHRPVGAVEYPLFLKRRHVPCSHFIAANSRGDEAFEPGLRLYRRPAPAASMSIWPPARDQLRSSRSVWSAPYSGALDTFSKVLW